MLSASPSLKGSAVSDQQKTSTTAVNTTQQNITEKQPIGYPEKPRESTAPLQKPVQNVPITPHRVSLPNSTAKRLCLMPLLVLAAVFLFEIIYTVIDINETYEYYNLTARPNYLHWTISENLPRIFSNVALAAILPTVLWNMYCKKSAQKAYLRLGFVACGVLAFQVAVACFFYYTEKPSVFWNSDTDVIWYYLRFVPGIYSFLDYNDIWSNIEEIILFLPTIATATAAFVTARKGLVSTYYSSSASTVIPSREMKPYPTKPAHVYTAPGMKWYYFLIYFVLLVAPIASLYSGYMMIAEDVSVTFGIATIALAVYAYVVRYQLAKFKFNAPTHVTVYYSISLGLSVFQSIAEYQQMESSYGWLMRETPMSGYLAISIIISVIVGACVIGCNRVYFEKRDHLFLN